MREPLNLYFDFLSLFYLSFVKIGLTVPSGRGFIENFLSVYGQTGVINPIGNAFRLVFGSANV